MKAVFKKEKEEDSPGRLGPDRRRDRSRTVDPKERKRRDRSPAIKKCFLSFFLHLGILPFYARS